MGATKTKPTSPSVVTTLLIYEYRFDTVKSNQVRWPAQRVFGILHTQRTTSATAVSLLAPPPSRNHNPTNKNASALPEGSVPQRYMTKCSRHGGMYTQSTSQQPAILSLLFCLRAMAKSWRRANRTGDREGMWSSEAIEAERRQRSQDQMSRCNPESDMSVVRLFTSAQEISYGCAHLSKTAELSY